MRKKYVSYQMEDYHLREVNGELVFGSNPTPLNYFFEKAVIEMVRTNSYFKKIELVSDYEHDENSYRMHYILFKSEISGALTFRVCIDTRGDFQFDFDY